MPLYRTIVPRIRKSLEVHGVFGTFRLSFAAPVRFIREYQAARRSYRPTGPDAFDLAHQVETSRRVHQSDLSTSSRNWVYGVGYWPTPVALVRQILSFFPIRHEEFTFIDLGSGKGRVLLLASDYAFEKIIGVEYAPELQQAAQANIRRYESPSQKCRAIEVICQDMTEFELPEKPLLIFLYNPASEPVMRIVARNIISSLRACPRPIWIAYVTPSYNVFGGGLPGPVTLREVKLTDQYAIYSSALSVTRSET